LTDDEVVFGSHSRTPRAGHETPFRLPFGRFTATCQRASRRAAPP
jgi:hypothetical protein